MEKVIFETEEDDDESQDRGSRIPLPLKAPGGQIVSDGGLAPTVMENHGLATAIAVTEEDDDDRKDDDEGRQADGQG